MHIPVLLHEVIRLLDPKMGEFFIDGTIDGGGHAQEILKRVGPKGILLGVDWDESMVANLKRDPRMQAIKCKKVFVHGNYADLPEILKKERLPKANGLLLDLGFSSAQLESGKGFSFDNDEPLSMTYSVSETPVSDLLRKLTEQELANVIYRFGGERLSRQIAKAIKTQQREKPIRTTADLADVIRRAVPRSYERGRIDPATRTFQALRIHANRELENVENLLDRLPEILKPGARVAIISFHSLEDRIVKQKFRAMEKEGLLEIMTKKPIKPALEEMRTNPRSRSAMLRAAKINKQ